MKTETIKLSQIKTNESNPRQIKDEKFSKLVNSILVFPKMLEIRPIVVDNTFVALGGNMRYRALVFIAEMQISDIVKRLGEIRDYGKKTASEKSNLIEYWERWIESPTAIIIKASELSDEEKREFIIKDNTGFGDWDYDMLANDWDNEDLNDWGVDVWQDTDLKDFFNSENPQSNRESKEKLCPHCGKDINKDAEYYEKTVINSQRGTLV